MPAHSYDSPNLQFFSSSLLVNVYASIEDSISVFFCAIYRLPKYAIPPSFTFMSLSEAATADSLSNTHGWTEVCPRPTYPVAPGRDLYR